MLIETICIMAGFLVTVLGCLAGLYILSTIPGTVAQVRADADVRKARIEARADMALEDRDYSESEESGDDPTGLNSIARMLGYTDVGSALSDPAIIGKLMGKSSAEPTQRMEE